MGNNYYYDEATGKSYPSGSSYAGGDGSYVISGSTTYAELDLFYHYDNRRPGSAKENSGARINSAFFGELNGSDVGEDTVAEGTKLQAKLKVVNCFAFTSNDYR